MAPGQEIREFVHFQTYFSCFASTPSTNEIRVMTCIVTCQIDMIGRACHYYCRHRSESVRQTSSYYHTTLQPYRSPEASSSTRQHHEREAAYPRCIGACNPSSRIGRAGGVDAYTPTTLHHCQPPREKLALSLQWWCCSSVSCCCAGSSSVRFSSNYACLLPPFAYLCIRPPPRSVSAVRAALPGLFWNVWYRPHSKLCV